jgi:hypothetical protein
MAPVGKYNSSRGHQQPLPLPGQVVAQLPGIQPRDTLLNGALTCFRQNEKPMTPLPKGKTKHNRGNASPPLTTDVSQRRHLFRTIHSMLCYFLMKLRLFLYIALLFLCK